MKIKKRGMALWLLLALLLPMLFACAGEPPLQGATTAGEEATAAPAAEGILASALSDYSIVYPQESSGSAELLRAIAELNSAIKKSFDLKLSTKKDTLAGGEAAPVREILIGNTNRAESQAVYAEGLRAFDYEIRLCGEKLVVASPTEQGLLAALEALKAALPAGGAYFFPQSAQISYQAAYPLQQLTLGGVELSAYSIVSGMDAGAALAEQLAKAIYTHTGIILPVVSDPGKGGAHRIYVGKTGASLPPELTDAESLDQYFVGAAGGHIYLYGADTATQVKAVKHFTDAMQALTGAAGSLSCHEGVILSASDTVTSMSFNLYVSGYSEARAARVIEMIRRHKPDTLGVQEANWRWMAKLQAELGSEYAYVGIGRDGTASDEHSAVFYRKARFEVNESGTKWLSDTPDQAGSKYDGSAYVRIMTYAVLTDLVTNRQLLHINTHLDYESDAVSLKQAKVLMSFAAQYAHLPILISGDFNEKLGSATIGHILQNGMDNSSDVAYHAQQSNNPNQTKIIDFIFVSQGDFTVYEYLMDGSKINGDYPSDHSPVIIRYALTSIS